MYPVQNYPVYPNQLQYQNPYMQPQVNAVKIDINNPQAYGGVNSHGQINPIAPAPQVMPTNYAPVYSSIPSASQYSPQVAYPQPWLGPVVMPQPQQTTATATATAQAPVAQVPAQVPVAPMPTPVPVPPVVVVPPTTTTTSTTSTTTPEVKTVIPTPVPVVPTPVPVVTAPVNQTVNVNPPVAVVDSAQAAQAAPTAQATATATATTGAPVAPVAPVETKQELEPEVNAILTDLASANPDAQTAAIQKMAEIAQTNPVASKAFLNEQTFGQLVNVINADTSKLQGPVEGQDPNVLSPLEKAEINKQFAVYTLAILQKNFRDEINKEMKKNNYPDIAINDLPYIKEGIVNNLKDNPNPTIREACLSALNYVGRPEDKEVLRVLYDISAKHDASPDVKAVAAEYLSKLPA